MLRVTLLGEQMIGDGAGTLRQRSSRSIALVAFLVVHSEVPQTRQRIAATFWPDSTDEQALTNLRRELHHLRSMLSGDPSLVVTARDLCWRDSPTCEVDVRTFAVRRGAALAARRDPSTFLTHAEAAVACYRGGFLPGAYDEWVLEARAELEQQCVDLLDLIGQERSRSGDLDMAVDAARKRVQLRPLDEIGYRTLMARLGDIGDRARAVSTYHHCASVLERELGVEPDPGTRAVLDRLLARSEPIPLTSSGAAPRRRHGPAAAHLVGRNAEYAALLDLWRAAARGHPLLAVVSGDPGVGKTRLVAEVAESASRGGAVVASAQCFGAAGRLALAPVADWLRTPEIRARIGGLEQVWRFEVERLVPSAAARGDPAGPRVMVDAWQRHRFFEGLTRALLAVQRPLLLLVDNLHWCDQETLAFVTFCLGLLPDAPVMVLATLRDDYTDDVGLAEWMRRMRAGGLLTPVVLGPFDVAESTELAESIIGRRLSADDAHVLQATTGGFPLHIIEAARGSAELPVGDLGAVLRHRFEQVSPTARAVAGLAAAVGRTFTLDLLVEAADLGVDEVVRAVDELWRRRILHEVGDGYDFSHDLVRDAAYAAVSPPTRWLLHRRLAQGLELLHADDPDAVSAQLAEQHARGGREGRAVGYYQRAAAIAMKRFAHAEAVRLLSAALAIVRAQPEGTQRADQELALLEAMAAPLNARHGYASSQVRETVEEAVALAEALDRPGSVLDGLIGLWSSQFVRGETAASGRTARRALELAGPESPRSGPAHFACGGSAVSLGRPQAALRHLAFVAHLGKAEPLVIGTHPDVHAMAFAAHAHWLLGHDDDAQASCAQAIALARTTGSPYNLACALAYTAVTQQLRADRPALAGVIGELRELCDRYEFAYYREWGMILDGWSRADGSGAELIRRGIEGLTAIGALARMPYWLSLAAAAAAEDGRLGVARANLDAAIVGGQARDDVWWLPEVLRMRAAFDEPEQAVARLRSAADMAAAQGSVVLLRRCVEDLAARGVRDPAFGVRPPTDRPRSSPNGVRTARS